MVVYHAEAGRSLISEPTWSRKQVILASQGHIVRSSLKTMTFASRLNLKDIMPNE